MESIRKHSMGYHFLKLLLQLCIPKCMSVLSSTEKGVSYCSQKTENTLPHANFLHYCQAKGCVHITYICMLKTENL